MVTLRDISVDLTPGSTATVVLGDGDPRTRDAGGSVLVQLYGNGTTPGNAPSAAARSKASGARSSTAMAE